VQLRGMYYPDLLKLFYTNARKENGMQYQGWKG